MQLACLRLSAQLLEHVSAMLLTDEEQDEKHHEPHRVGKEWDAVLWGEKVGPALSCYLLWFGAPG